MEHDRGKVLVQATCFLVGFITASLFYKFGSFALECGAFLATWFGLDAAWQAAIALLGETAATRSGTRVPEAEPYRLKRMKCGTAPPASRTYPPATHSSPSSPDRRDVL